MRRFFKYSWRLLVLLLVLLLAIYFIVLHTQFGARWTINYFTKQVPLKIQTIEGTLANQIKLTEISFNNGQTSVVTKELNYQIKDIHWLSKKLVVEHIGLQNIKINLLEPTNKDTSSAAFEGISLPIEIEVHSITINDLRILSNDSTETIQQIDMAVHIKEQDVNISKLSVQNQNMSVDGEVSIQLKPNLPFVVDTNWNLFDEDNKLTGQSQISGTTNKIDLKNVVIIENGLLLGHVNINALLDLDHDQPKINATVTSDNLVINYPNQKPITIQPMTSTLIGATNDYELTSNLTFFNKEIDLTELSVKGKGNLDSIDIQTLTLKNSKGSINLPSTLNWANEITANTQLELLHFDTSAYLPQWPGLVNGTANIISKYSADDNYSISVNKANLKGKLKQMELLITGNAKIKPDDIFIDGMQVMLGDNKLDIQASVKKQYIQADLKLEFNDLSLLDKRTKGSVSSNFKIVGDINNPNIIGQALVNNLKYQDYQIATLAMDINGDWLNHISIQTNVQGFDSKSKSFEMITLNINGNKNKHDVNLFFEDETISSKISVKGSLDEITNEWIGQVIQNDIELKDIQSTWNLKEPVSINYKKDIDLSKTCWINQETSGDICLDFAISAQNNNHQINLELKKLNVRFLRIFLPNDIIVNGKLDGNVEIRLFEDNVIVDSDVELLDGELHFFKDSKQSYKTKIKKALLIAKQDKQSSTINTIIKLDDGTNLDFNFDLFKTTNDQLEIKGDINGVFANTQYLVLFSDEIEQMKGDFNIVGTIQGPIKQLKSNFKATQNQGYLILSQSKTKLENLSFEILKEPLLDSSFKLSGTAGKGKFKSTGKLSIEKRSPELLWQLDAEITGDNMRLLTLPELELDITPNLRITANNNSALISGEINIPYALVNIKQLPESAISSSPDVIVHSSSEMIEESDVYPVNFDVTAHINETIKVDVLGLKSDLQGSLKVSNTENSIINGYGSLKLINGKYSIYGQTLDISKGELFFNGPIDNPTLDVLASRKSISGDVTAGVELGGTVNYLQSSLYSDPLLSDLEILSYILSGRGLNEESDTSTQQLAQAAILLGLKKSSPVFSEIQSKLGIDVLTIKEGATAKDSIVEAGKQFNENLYVGYNQGLFNRIGFWVLRYRINKALRLETTQGENQSVDLIYVRKKK